MVLRFNFSPIQANIVLRGLVASATLVASSACSTSIKTAPDLLRSDLTGINGSNRGAIEGVPYALPMLQYEMTLTYKLTECYHPGISKTLVRRSALAPSGSVDNGETGGNPREEEALTVDRLSAESVEETSPEYDSVVIIQSQDTDDDGSVFVPEFELVDTDGSDKFAGKFKVDVSMEADAAFIVGERYSINYDALSSYWKTTVFEIETHEETGTLKSINVSAEDQTAEVVSSAVKLALSGAALASPINVEAIDMTLHGGVPPRGSLTKSTEVVCTPEAARTLVARDQAIADLAAANAQLEALNATSEMLKLMVRFYEPKEAITEINDFVVDIQNATQLVERNQKTLAGLNAALSVSQKHTWPEDFFEFTKTIDDRAKIEKWISKPINGGTLFDVATFDLKNPLRSKDGRKAGFGTNGVCGLIHPDQGAPPILSEIECLMDRLTPAVQLKEISPVQECTGTIRPQDEECLFKSASITNARNVAEDNGIFVRPPVPGALQMCIASESKATIDANGDYESLPCDKDLRFSESAAVVPQLGQLRYLPFSNGPFANNALAVSIGQKGHLNKFSYKTTSAQAAGLLSAAADAAKQIETYQKERAEAELKAIQTARSEGAAQRAEQLAELTFKIDLLEKQKELLDLENPNVSAVEIAEETASLQAQILLLKSRKELLELQQQANN